MYVLMKKIYIYSGVIYFKRKEDAVKAVEILGERVKSLFG